MKGKIREILNLNKKKQNRHTRNQTVPIEEEKHLGNETLSVGKQTKEDGKILAVKEATKVIIRISDVEGNKIAKISLGSDEADIEHLCSMDNDGVSKSLLNEDSAPFISGAVETRGIADTLMISNTPSFDRSIDGSSPSIQSQCSEDSNESFAGCGAESDNDERKLSFSRLISDLLFECQEILNVTNLFDDLIGEYSIVAEEMGLKATKVK
jgi:hypothetical protein